MKYSDIPLSTLLRQRPYFEVFDKAFEEYGWLDVMALLNSDSTIEDLYRDDTVPKKVLDEIVEKLSEI